MGHGQDDRRSAGRDVADSVTAEALVTEQFQPVTMGLADEQFCRGFANAFRSFATNQTAMVQEESQQIEVAVADVAVQEKVIT